MKFDSVYIVRTYSPAALATFADWLAEHPDTVEFQGAHVMRVVDCYLPGDVVFAIATGERELHASLAAKSGGLPWDGSILRPEDFEHFWGHSRLLSEIAPSLNRADNVRKLGEELLYPSHDALYATKVQKLYELRHKCYRSRMLAGSAHPRDVVASASTLTELRFMAQQYYPEADFSQVQ